jgi:SAM-dependent methyltransferase
LIDSGLRTLNGAPGVKSLIKRIISPKVPPHLARRFVTISATSTNIITESLRSHYYTRQTWGELAVEPETILATEEGPKDLENHEHTRLDVFRATVIPWLDEAKSLAGADVLEIGCGTGSSTVALAEQGANVVAVDIDDKALVSRAIGVEPMVCNVPY